MGLAKRLLIPSTLLCALAYVCSSLTPETAVVTVADHTVAGKVRQIRAPDDQEEASGTTCLRKFRTPSPKRSSKSPATDRSKNLFGARP